MNSGSEWRRLYSYARLTRDINPALAGHVLRGTIKPHYGLNLFIEKHYAKKQESFYAG